MVVVPAVASVVAGSAGTAVRLAALLASSFR